VNKLVSLLLWPAIAIVGAFAFAALALGRGENVSSVWLVTAALSVYLIAYRFYSKFIADKVLRLDPARPTPAVRHNDGLDYVPTNKWILYGHHFAAIAGAGPLVGPVLAAQMGFLPGTLWILVGVVFAGAVQDFIVLFVSVRRDGKSLGEMIKMELGPIPGTLALVGVLAIMIIILAVLALVVVKALTGSPWGLFTIFATIPIALLMGCYMRFIRPGRVGEASAFGVVLLLVSIFLGRVVAEDPAWAPLFTLSGTELAWALILYGAIAASLPVWLMLAPRDYLSTFLKIGTIVALAIGIYYVAPKLAMPMKSPSGPITASQPNRTAASIAILTWAEPMIALRRSAGWASSNRPIVAWSPDSRMLAYISATAEELDSSDDPRVIDRIQYKSRTSLSDRLRTHVWLTDVDAPQTI